MEFHETDRDHQQSRILAGADVLQSLLALAKKAHDKEMKALRCISELQQRIQSLMSEEAVPLERVPLDDSVPSDEASELLQPLQSASGSKWIRAVVEPQEAKMLDSLSYTNVSSLDSRSATSLCDSQGRSLQRPDTSAPKALATRAVSMEAQASQDSPRPSLRDMLPSSSRRVRSSPVQLDVDEESPPQNLSRKLGRIQSMHNMRHMSSHADAVKTLSVITRLFGIGSDGPADVDSQRSALQEPRKSKTPAADNEGMGTVHESSDVTDDAKRREIVCLDGDGDICDSFFPQPFSLAQMEKRSTGGMYAGFELRPAWTSGDLLGSSKVGRSVMLPEGLGSNLTSYLQMRRSSSGWGNSGSGSLRRLSNTSEVSMDVIRSKSRMANCLIIHPGSPCRAFWDSMGIFMIVFDMFTIPIQVFDPEPGWFLSTMGWSSQLFWNFDIIASFFTGYWKDGQAVMMWTSIVRHYITTWFLFDCTIVGIDWMLYFLVKSTEKSAASATKVSKMSRVLRFLRTLRLLKVFKVSMAQDMFEEVFDVFASESAYTQLSIVKIMCAILTINHFVACIWYGIGKEREGWVGRYEVSGQGIIHRYACSYHWSIAQFGVGNVGIEAKSTAEHIFSVVVLLCALVLFSCLVSSATNALARYQQQRTDELRQFGLFRRFCRQTGIPRSLTKRAMNYLEYESRELQRRIDHQEVGLLSRLSEPLVAELMYWKYLPHMQTNPLIDFLCRESSLVMHKVAIEALSAKLGGRNDVLLTFGEQADQVFYIIGGELHYKWRQEPDNIIRVQHGMWIGEPAIWTLWLYLGDLQAVTGCSLLVVNVQKFGEAIGKNPEIWGTAVMYAEAFVDYLKSTNVNALSDIRPLEHVYPFEEVLEKSARKRRHVPVRTCFARFCRGQSHHRS